MKKIVAVMMALLLALSCTMALAEPSGASGLTVESKLTVDRDALSAALTQLGVAEPYMNLIDTVAAVLTEAGEVAVLADGGAQVDLTLKGQPVLSLGVELNDAGLSVGSDLFPNSLLTLSAEAMGEMLGQMLGEMLTAALDRAQQGLEGLQDIDFESVTRNVSGYLNSYTDSLNAAIRPGEPEKGEYEVEGYAFNTKTPVQVDMLVIATATNTLVDELNNDQTVQAALQALRGMGVDVTLPEKISTEDLPDFDVQIYTTEGENGESTGASCVSIQTVVQDPATLNVVKDGEDMKLVLNIPASRSMNVRVNEGDPEVAVEAPESGSYVALQILPADGGMDARLDAEVAGLYFGASLSTYTEDPVGYDCSLFLMDGDTPVLNEQTRVTEGGQRTLSLDGEGKTVLDMAQLSDSKSDAASALMMDVVFNGLSGVLSKATEAMPDEVGALMSLIQVQQEEEN